MNVTPGQKVWLSPEGNFTRMYRKTSLPIEAVVTAVKRKYFYVRRLNASREEKFPIGSEHSTDEDANASWRIWDSREAYDEETARLARLGEIQAVFRRFRIEEEISATATELIHGILVKDGLIRPEPGETEERT